MTIHLLNSAMMPQPGSYSLVTVNADAWRIAFEAAREQGADFKSYIGYPQTAAEAGRQAVQTAAATMTKGRG